MFGRKLERLG